ncbi:MAG: hypothetical protein HUJ31_00585, partial [Pseudomonadales bacterium]|nr:hypothetical protein [Pseudomonadales bacterium]
GRLDSNESEIRKLWDVSNKRNKEWIRANESAIASLKNSNSSMGNRVDTVENNVGQVVTKFNQLAEQMTTLRRNLIDENEEMATQVSLLRGQVQDQSVKMEANGRTISRLQQQMKENQEAITAIDRYRQQINQRLMDLQAQIQGTASASP